MSKDQRTPGPDLMRQLIAAMPGHLAASGQLPGLERVEAPASPPARLVICGMGGSAIAGDLVAPLPARTQLVVHRDYGLPAWLGPGDLVLASSYSGNTEETLSAWREAERRGCQRMAMTSGGRLAEEAAAGGVPVVVMPEGLPPRAALGHGCGALVHVLGRLGCLENTDAMVADAVTELERHTAGRLERTDAAQDGTGNPHPRRVAGDLLEAVAVIHTGGGEAHAAGARLRAQLNENAKVPALLAAYPELDHNEVEAWDPARAQTGDFALVCLRSEHLAPELERRVTVTRGLLARSFVASHTVCGSGAGSFARIMSLVQWGDALSWHLADLRGIDPVPVDRIEELKRALAAGPGA